MIAEMYKRREKMGYVFLSITVIVILGWTLLHTPETTREWLEMLVFLLPLALIFTIIVSSRSHFNKVRSMNIPNSGQQLTDLNQLVIKKDAGWVPKLFLFKKDGKFIGMVKPINIPWWMYPVFTFTELVSILPLTYGFVSANGDVEFTFHKQGWLKQVKLTIFDQGNKRVGTYIQEELKALFKIKGKLYNEEDKLILPIHASGFNGEFSWKDEQDNCWAYFYNGRFPHEYTTIFRDTHNDMVELSDQISEQDKTRLLAVIGYLFIDRIKN